MKWDIIRIAAAAIVENDQADNMLFNNLLSGAVIGSFTTESRPEVTAFVESLRKEVASRKTSVKLAARAMNSKPAFVKMAAAAILEEPELEKILNGSFATTIVLAMLPTAVSSDVQKFLADVRQEVSLRKITGGGPVIDVKTKRVTVDHACAG